MNIIVCNTQVSINKDGLYCLNDLHKAAGGLEKDQPALWLRLDKTKEFIEECSNSTEMQNKIISSKSGRYGGTYVCKELVYSYAMWISPKFQLLVIRVFDEWLHEEYRRKAIRENARDGYKDLTKAIKESRGDTAKWYHYSNEADMINRIVLGHTAKTFRLIHGIPDSEPLRERLSTFQIDAIEQLQRMDEQLIILEYDLDQRKTALTNRYMKFLDNLKQDKIKSECSLDG